MFITTKTKKKTEKTKKSIKNIKYLLNKKKSLKKHKLFNKKIYICNSVCNNIFIRYIYVYYYHYDIFILYYN